MIGLDLGERNSSEKRCQEGATLKGEPQLADRKETAYHIHKDTTARYALYLRHAQLPTYKLSLATRLYGQWLIENDLDNYGLVA